MSTNYIKLITSSDTILVTEEHPFYVENKGWKKVKYLTTDDIFKTINYQNKIYFISKRTIETNVVVYNLEVAGNHNYFITKDCILVHNKNYTPLLK